MIKVEAKVTDLSRGNEALRHLARSMGGIEVSVGIHADAEPYPGGQTVAEVALWNEFGTTTIPERSFLRSAVDANEDKINKWIEELWEASIEEAGKLAAKVDLRALKVQLESLGFKVKTLIEKQITSNVPPPYGTGRGKVTPEEVIRRQIAKRKRGAIMGSNTLVETGHLLKSISYQVKIGNGKGSIQ